MTQPAFSYSLNETARRLIMKISEFIMKSLEESRGDIENSIKNLAEEELTFRPKTHSNSIIFLMWHLARVEDMWINRMILGTKEKYEADGWYKKFRTGAQENGIGFDLSKLAAWPVPDLGLLQQYSSAVRAKTLDYLTGLDDKSLDELKDLGWTKGRVGSILSHLVTEVGGHSGQIGYIYGILKSLGPNGAPPKID
jgi:uncharacterized damage-inducible protein DinB